MIKLVIVFLVVVLIGYIALCTLLYSMQRSLLYYPTLPVTTPEAEPFLMHNGEELLRVWHVERPGQDALIYFGGNAEDVAVNIPQFKRLFPNHSLYLLNYRGYGGSSGKPTEAGLHSDAQALYSLVQKEHNNITLMGRSLGTGVAVNLASIKKIERLILVTPYDSIVNVAAGIYKFIPVHALLKDTFDSVSHADKLKNPVLILIAEHDELVPRKRTDNFVAALNPNITNVQVINDTDHNSICTSPEFEQDIVAFMTQSPRRLVR
ncbi:alpha/beta hydrolase [Desulfosediminicola flagellatus]|uniref:alpha/beta hydrolase n=1 Tax=Desulfosediminicola flagellatus TaxID=2569541 RepID=UPI0010AC16ED|nr:alpha/beta hydrolase [Desulfosediminicola flagellatus]